jgi:hypothetical protein
MGNRRDCGLIPDRTRYFSLLRPDAVDERKIFFPSLVVQPVAYLEFLRKHNNVISNLGNPLSCLHFSKANTKYDIYESSK